MVAKTDEMKIDEMKIDEMKTDAMKTDEAADKRVAAHRQSLARTLRRLRAERNLSQSDLAKATGMSSSFLGLVEQCRSDITLGRVLRLAKFFDMKLTDFLGDTDGPDRDPVRVLRTDPGRVILADDPGITVFDLGAGPMSTMMTALSTLEPGARTEVTEIDEPEAMLFVIDGIVEFEFSGRETHRLKRGEGVIFTNAAPTPYYVRNVAKRTGRVLWVGLRNAPQSDS
jgi:transcriptional regulator with XRE-family HTH domain